MKTTRLSVLAVLTAVSLSVAACGGQASSGAAGGEDFSVVTIEGERFDLSGSQGEVVALYFMAGW